MTLHKSSTRKVQPMGDSMMLRSGFIGGGANAATDELLKSFTQQTAPTLLLDDKQKQQQEQAGEEDQQKQRIGLLTLLQYATKTERSLMLLGIVMAAISGLCMPTWLLLLAQSLSTFNQIGQLLATVGEQAIDILLGELYKLIYSFAIVGKSLSKYIDRFISLRSQKISQYTVHSLSRRHYSN